MKKIGLILISIALMASIASAQTTVYGAGSGGGAAAASTAPTTDSLGFTTHINWQGTTYESNTASGVVLGDVKAGSTFMEGVGRAFPTTPFTLTVEFAVQPQQNFVMGIGIVSSASGPMEEMEYHWNGGPLFDIQTWNSPTAYNATTTTSITSAYLQNVWLRLVYDGTNLKWYYASTKDNWFLVSSETAASSFTYATGMNYLALTFSPWAADMQTVVESYSLTTP